MLALDDVFDFGHSITRHGLYCEGTINVLQCDTAYMIGNEMFKKLCLPSLKFQLRRIELFIATYVDSPDEENRVIDKIKS